MCRSGMFSAHGNIPKRDAHLSGLFTAPMTIQNDGEFSYAIIDLADVRTGVAEDQATSGRRDEAAAGQGHGGNALLRGLLGNFPIVDSRWEESNQVHAGFGSDQVEEISHLPANRFDQGRTAIHAEHSQSADMASEVALADEVG